MTSLFQEWVLLMFQQIFKLLKNSKSMAMLSGLITSLMEETQCKSKKHRSLEISLTGEILLITQIRKLQSKLTSMFKVVQMSTQKQLETSFSVITEFLKPMNIPTTTMECIPMRQQSCCMKYLWLLKELKIQKLFQQKE